MPSWLEILEATLIYQYFRKLMNRELVLYLNNEALSGELNLRVCEVACGSGYASHLISKLPGVSLSLAADINLDDHRQATIQEFGASFIMMDLYLPAISHESMDLVWNSSSIEEMKRPSEAIRAMVSLVKPGGHIFVGVPYRKGVVGFLSLFASQTSRDWLGRPYSQTELIELMEQNSISVKSIKKYFFGIFIGALGNKLTR